MLSHSSPSDELISNRYAEGNGDQDVFTDFGAACCDTSTTSGWKEAGSDSITKTIDISQCKFEKISYLFTGLVGGGPVDNLVRVIAQVLTYTPDSRLKT